MTDPLELISFPGTGNLPFFAGSEKGLYEARGVSVNLETTPSSMYQAQHLVAGSNDREVGLVQNDVREVVDGFSQQVDVV